MNVTFTQATLRCGMAMALLLSVVSTGAQSLEASDTVIEALKTSGFQEAAKRPGAPDGQRKLTSSTFAATSDTFAAAYFYDDEIKLGGLGKLRVSLFDRSDKRWIHSPNVPDDAGSALHLALDGDYVLLDTHRNPSAGGGLIFRRADLRLIARVDGFGLREMPGPLVRYTANMVHFAATHQDRLMVFSPRRRDRLEVFPGRRTSDLSAAYRRRIQAAYAALPAPEKVEFQTSNYGPVDDFDRAFVGIEHSADGRRLGMVVVYGHRLPESAAVADLETVVSCALADARAWQCQERELQAFAKARALTMERHETGALAKTSVAALLRAALK